MLTTVDRHRRDHVPSTASGPAAACDLAAAVGHRGMRGLNEEGVTITQQYVAQADALLLDGFAEVWKRGDALRQLLRTE